MLKRSYIIINTQKDYNIFLNDYKSLLSYESNDELINLKNISAIN